MAEIQPGQEDSRQQRVVPWREGHTDVAAHSHALKKLLVLLIAPATLHLTVQLAQDLVLKLWREA